MALQDTLYVQEYGGALWVNRTAAGASGHPGAENREIGVYQLVKRARIVTTLEEIPAGEKAAEAPQD